MKERDLKGLPVKQMMKCEGCGEYHPMEDCEVVVIKIIKGKDCKMPAGPSYRASREEETRLTKAFKTDLPADVLKQQEEDRKPVDERMPTDAERELIKAIIKKKRSLPPADLVGAFGAPPAY